MLKSNKNSEKKKKKEIENLLTFELTNLITSYTKLNSTN